MISNRGSYALITGARGGIGHDLARLLAGAHRDVVVVARSEEKLEKLRGVLQKDHGVKLSVIVRELADPESTQDIFKDLNSEGIDLLVGVAPSSQTWVNNILSFCDAVARGLQAKIS